MDLAELQTIVPAERGSTDRWRAGDGWLAGGTWLFSEPQPGLDRLFDLTAFAWPSLVAGEHGLEIAATCTLAELARWPGQPEWPASSLPARCCDALVGSFKVWNAATVGGNICLALPAGPMIALAAGLDGVCTIWSPGGGARSLAVADFVLGPRDNALEAGELLRSITLPATALRSHTALRQFSRTPLGRSAVLLIGRRAVTTGEVVITITASVRRPVQLRFESLPSAAELRAAIEDAELDYYDDVHGHPEWRRQLTRLLAGQLRNELEELP